MSIKEYESFTFVEWSRIIGTIITLFRLLLKASDSTGVDSSTIHELTQFGKYFEILCFRMNELSNIKGETTEPPNIFCLWESVLRIVRDKYTQLVTNMIGKTSHMLGPKTMCPVLSGGLRRTEFWDAFTQDDFAEFTTTSGTNMNVPLAGDWIAWDSLFSTTNELESNRAAVV